MADLTSVLAAYALGSVLWGVVLGRAFKGRDPRVNDNPGGSGSFRQFGPIIGTSVAVLDLGKGALAIAIAKSLGASRKGLALTAAAAVAGHNWPVWFGYNGGGGLATMIGSMVSLAPVETIKAVIVSLIVAVLYKLSPFYLKLPISSLPGGAVVGLPYLVYTTWSSGDMTNFLAALLGALAIGLRGLQMLYKGRKGMLNG